MRYLNFEPAFKKDKKTPLDEVQRAIKIEVS
jgi:hypothetical protein